MSRIHSSVRHAGRRCLPALSLALVASCTEAPTHAQALSRSDIPSGADLVAAARAEGLVRVTYPDPDPGIPAYARIGAPLNQVFHTADWAVIPFYRTPEAVPGHFDLMTLFDFPGPGGPGAFGVPLTISGFYMIEDGAPLGTFPRLAISTGNAVPVWFVPWPRLREALSAGALTMDALRALQPLVGTAEQFEETLRPRVGEHLVVINARGRMADGRRFDVHVTHVEAVTCSIRITIR